MRRFQKLTTMIVIVALMVVMFPAALAFADEETVVIFHTNDVHGRAEGAKAKDDDGKPVESGSIGYARYKTILDRERKEKGAEMVLALDAGDALHGTNFATLSRGESMVELMGMVGVNAMTCGNHEFNYGPERLKELENLALFPIMGQNISNTESLEKFFAKNSFSIQPTDDISIGVIGLTSPETKVKADPRYTEDLSFGAGPKEDDLDMFSKVAQAEIDALKKNGIGFIVLLTHLGVDQESAIRSDLLIPKLKGVDLVIDGHSHTTYEEGKVIKDADGRDVLLVQTGSYFESIGKVTLTFDDGKLTSKKAELLTFADVRDIEGDAAVQKKIDEFNAANDEVLKEVIGKTATELDGVREHVRAGETNLGNLITDSILKASGADVVFTNGGGIRASIAAGDITMGDAMTVLPFGNLVTVIKVKGQDILDALAFGAQSYPEPAGGFPHVAGMTYTIITDDDGKFSMIGDVTVGGEPLDPEKEYTLATNDFLASGGDGYEMFGGKEQVTLLGLMLDIFVDEVKALSGSGSFTVEVDGRLKIVKESELPEPTEDQEPTTEPTTKPTTKPSEEVTETTPVADGAGNDKGGYTVYIVIGVLLLIAVVGYMVYRRRKAQR